jgi:DHA1 family multidrug resistance protein-like MFS transporter
MFSLYCIEEFDLTSSDLGFILVALSAIYTLVTIFVFNELAAKFDVYITCGIGCLIFAVTFAVCTLFSSLWTFLLVCVIGLGTGFGIVVPSVYAMAANFTNNLNRGQVMSAVEVSNKIANVIAPLLHGMLFDINIRYPFYLASGVVFAAFLMLIGLIKYIKIEIVERESQSESDFVRMEDVDFIVDSADQMNHRLHAMHCIARASFH